MSDSCENGRPTSQVLIFVELDEAFRLSYVSEYLTQVKKQALLNFSIFTTSPLSAQSKCTRQKQQQQATGETV